MSRPPPAVGQAVHNGAAPAVHSDLALYRSLAYFGTYAASDADHVLTLKVDRSSYPNWDGTDQKRQISLTGDELKWTNLASSGGGTAELTWRRAK